MSAETSEAPQESDSNMPVSQPIQSELKGSHTHTHTQNKRNMFRFQLVCSKQSNIFSSYITNLFIFMIVTKKDLFFKEQIFGGWVASEL